MPLARGVRDRFLQKPKAVIDLNLLTAGRKVDEEPFTALRVNYTFRTGFFKGRQSYSGSNSLIERNIIRTSSIWNPEGVEIIPPFIPGSPGFILFYDYPLMKLNSIRELVAELQTALAIRAVGALETRDLGSLKNIIYEVVDMFTGVRNRIDTIQPQMPMGFQPIQKPNLNE